MAYSDGEALILTLLRTMSNFDSTNTARANWQILNKGRANHYGIVRPGAFSIEYLSLGQYQANWTTVIEVWQRYKDDGTTQTDLYARVADLLPMLNTPRLGDTTNTILDSRITGGDEPQEMWLTDGGGPAWLRWSVNIEWQEVGSC